MLGLALGSPVRRFRVGGLVILVLAGGRGVCGAARGRAAVTRYSLGRLEGTLYPYLYIEQHTL